MARHPEDIERAWVLTMQLRRRREEMGIRLGKMAAELGIEHSRLSDWECGRRCPSLPSLIRWARSLGCDVMLLYPTEISLVKTETARGAPCHGSRTIGRHGKKAA